MEWGRGEQHCNSHSHKSAIKIKSLYLQQQQILQLLTQRATEKMCFVVSEEQQRQLEIIITIIEASPWEPVQALYCNIVDIRSGIFYDTLNLKQTMERI